MTTIQRPVPHRLSVVLVVLYALSVAVLSAGEPRAADVTCGAPESEAVVSGIDGWRTLVTRDGERLIPAGITDFGTIEPASTRVRDEAEEALEGAMRSLSGRTIGVRRLIAQNDRRGRVPALIWADGKLLQQDLIERGLAIAFPGNGDLPCSEPLLAAESRARAARRGFWQEERDWIAGPRPEDFDGRINGYVIMQGRVVSVGTRPDRTYLNFGGRWASDVTVEIADANRAAFGGPEALETLAGARIRVRGFAIEKAGPMIELRRPWQIERLTNHPG